MKIIDWNRRGKKRKFKLLTTHVTIPLLEDKNGKQYHGYGEVKFKKGIIIEGRLDKTKNYIIIEEKTFSRGKEYNDTKYWLLGGLIKHSCFFLLSKECKAI